MKKKKYYEDIAVWKRLYGVGVYCFSITSSSNRLLLQENSLFGSDAGYCVFWWLL